MKIKLFMLVLLLMVVVSEGIGQDVKVERVKWASHISGVTTTTLAQPTTYQLAGALKTLISKPYANIGGDMCIQVNAFGGTTARFQVNIQQTISVDSDSNHWVNVYSVSWSDQWSDNNFVNTTADSCIKFGSSAPIFIPALAGDKFRFYVTTKSTHVGNTTFSIDLAREE